MNPLRTFRSGLLAALAMGAGVSPAFSETAVMARFQGCEADDVRALTAEGDKTWAGKTHVVPARIPRRFCHRRLGESRAMRWSNGASDTLRTSRMNRTAAMLSDPIPCPWVLVDGPKYEAEIPFLGSRRLRVLVMVADSLNLCTDKVPLESILMFRRAGSTSST